jgi:hypothetical protein
MAIKHFFTIASTTINREDYAPACTQRSSYLLMSAATTTGVVQYLTGLYVRSTYFTTIEDDDHPNITFFKRSLSCGGGVKGP